MINHFHDVSIHYAKRFWCGRGNHWVKKCKAVVKNGVHRCPVHGCQLRLHSRNPKFRRMEPKERATGWKQRKWDADLLKTLCEASGKAENVLRFTIMQLADDLNIDLWSETGVSH